jgi:hypothetical protein
MNFLQLTRTFSSSTLSDEMEGMKLRWAIEQHWGRGYGLVLDAPNEAWLIVCWAYRHKQCPQESSHSSTILDKWHQAQKEVPLSSALPRAQGLWHCHRRESDNVSDIGKVMRGARPTLKHFERSYGRQYKVAGFEDDFTRKALGKGSDK